MTNAQIRVGNAPVSWGVIENVEGERGGYARVLDEMHETGFAGTQAKRTLCAPPGCSPRWVDQIT